MSRRGPAHVALPAGRLPGAPPRAETATYQTISIRLSRREREMLFAIRAVAGTPDEPAEISHVVREWLMSAFDALPESVKAAVDAETL